MSLNFLKTFIKSFIILSILWLWHICSAETVKIIFLFVGPGRGILARGCSALYQNRPDMNSLVTLGASASFCVSLVATLVPSLGWPTFFEEPAMLLGCVLLGRALEERAKLAASSDLAALQVSSFVFKLKSYASCPQAFIFFTDTLAYSKYLSLDPENSMMARWELIPIFQGNRTPHIQDGMWCLS